MLGRLFPGGRQLSGGQWQRLALGRLYFRPASVQIFDEPTAALDAMAEAAMIDRLREHGNERITLLISHRFSTVRMADYDRRPPRGSRCRGRSARTPARAKRHLRHSFQPAGSGIPVNLSGAVTTAKSAAFRPTRVQQDVPLLHTRCESSIGTVRKRLNLRHKLTSGEWHPTCYRGMRQ